MTFGRSIRINKGAAFVLIFICLTGLYFYSKWSVRSKYLFIRNAHEIDLRKILIGSIQAAKRGGLEILLSSKKKLKKESKGKTKEGADDPVTEADSRSHCVMRSGLHRIFPKLVIISEEDSGKNACRDFAYFDLDPTVLHDNVIPDEIVDIRDVTMWIDPLDATQEFTEQLFDYVTTMVCVAVKGVPLIGVIHNPFTQKTTWAWVDRVKSEDLNFITRDKTISKTTSIVISRSHAGNVKNISKQVFGENTNILIAAGAGYKVLQVIFNNATAYFHTTRIKKWDICAGNAILNAVGGKMTNLLNEEIDYSSKDSSINDKGILSTFSNHEFYIQKIIEHKVMHE